MRRVVPKHLGNQVPRGLERGLTYTHIFVSSPRLLNASIMSDRAEEVETVQAIWEDINVEFVSEKDIYILKVPLNSSALAILTLNIDYPEKSLPQISFSGLSVRGEADELSTHIRESYKDRVGEMLVFDIISELRELLNSSANQSGDVDEEELLKEVTFEGVEYEKMLFSQHEQVREVNIEILSGPLLTDRKSTFQAHLARVTSQEQVEYVLQSLLSINKIARATHNMYAWRIRDPNTNKLICDQDDDGERAAGNCLAELLASMDVDNVIVVVTRWYGKCA